ncbi:MAG: hypothetical protein UX89_C0017G0022 [Parcubacteria group bacterium GW2011_GWA2_47_16]|nr:MAG: hypothetical protein UX89_C0017G0022 [Parcubacteria group bacterium GW2011_GWA2_47_16]
MCDAKKQNKNPVQHGPKLLGQKDKMKTESNTVGQLLKEASSLIGELPRGFAVHPDAKSDLPELERSVFYLREAVADYKNGQWPKKMGRDGCIVHPERWTASDTLGECGGWVPVAPHHVMPASTRLNLQALSGNPSVSDEIFARLQAAKVSTGAEAPKNQIIEVYRAEQLAEFDRGVRDGKKAVRQKVRNNPGTFAVSGLTDKTPVTDMPIANSAYFKAYGVGVARGFSEAQNRFIEKLERRYRRVGAGEKAAQQMAKFASYPNWRANLAGWFGNTKELLRRGVRVEEIRSLPTSFQGWAVGGTYRHRSLLVCDPTEVRRVLEGVPSDRMSPQGGAEKRALFGSTNQSRAGYIITDTGVEIYADQ